MIRVRIELISSHHIIDHASQLQTGSQIIVAAHNTVVSEVSRIGLNLVYHAFSKASFIVRPFSFIMFMYSTNIIEFQTTIQARAITHIIDVAEKYSLLNIYNKENQGNTHINQSKNAIIIIHATLKFLNCHTRSK